MDELIIRNLLNPKFNLSDVDLTTDVRDVFGVSLAPKLVDYLIPEDRLYSDDYTDDELTLEKVFAISPTNLLHWKNDYYKLGFLNGEIDAIAFILGTVLLNSDRAPKINRFFSKPYKQPLGV